MNPDYPAPRARLCRALFSPLAFGVLLAAAPLRAASVWYNNGTLAGWSSSNGGVYSYSFAQLNSGGTSPILWGANSLRCEIRYGEPDNGGRYHCMKSKDLMAAAGQTRWYKFGVFLPSYYDFRNQVWVAQLIMRSPAGTYHPHFALMLNSTGGSSTAGNWQVLRNGGSTTAHAPAYHSIAGDAGADRGKWAHFVFKITWATDATGALSAWKRNSAGAYDQVVAATNVQTLFSDQGAIQSRLDVGVYGTEWYGNPSPLSTAKVVVIDEVAVADDSGTTLANFATLAAP